MTALRSLSIGLALLAACGGSDGASGSSSGGPDASTPTGSPDASSPPTPPSGGDAGTSACDRPKPGPTNTGVPAGTALTPSGSIKVTQDGAIVENLDITGEITVLANDVTIRKVKITSGDYYPIRYFDNDNRGLVVEDSEIIGTSGDVTAAISFAHYTARRLNVHGSADGLKADADVLIEDCWIHDLSNGPTEHNDAVQMTGGKDVVIRHNVLGGASNACVMASAVGARVEGLVIECDWLSGGGYSLQVRGDAPNQPTGTRITNNRFARDQAYGPWAIDDPSPTITGNVHDDDGSAIPYP